MKKKQPDLTHSLTRGNARSRKRGPYIGFRGSCPAHSCVEKYKKCGKQVTLVSLATTLWWARPFFAAYGVEMGRV